LLSLVLYSYLVIMNEQLIQCTLLQQYIIYNAYIGI